MHIHLPHRNEARLLPRPIQEYLKKRFQVSPEEIKGLRCFVYEGIVGAKAVRRVSIFNPVEAVGKQVIIRTLTDLEKNPSLVQFEGYVDKKGIPYAADRRVPRKTGKKRQAEKE